MVRRQSSFPGVACPGPEALEEDYIGLAPVQESDIVREGNVIEVIQT